MADDNLFCFPFARVALGGGGFLDSGGMADLLDDFPDDYEDEDDEVVYDKEFILFALEHAESVLRFSNSLGSSSLDDGDEVENDIWESIPDELKADPDVAESALKHKVCQVVELPDKFQNDQAFLRKIVRDDLSVWHCLPDTMKSSSDFVQSLSHFSDMDMLDQILEEVPAFRGNRDIWRTAIQSAYQLQQDDEDGDDWPFHELSDILARHAPPEIRADADLMLMAVGYCADMHQLMDSQLRRDEYFLGRVLQKNPLVLSHLSHETQRLFPDHVSRTFSTYFEALFQGKGRKFDARALIEESEALARSIAPDLWDNRNVMRGWFTAGAALFHDTIFSESWRSDSELFLWIAKHTGQHPDWCCAGADATVAATDAHCLLGRSFGKACLSLRSDKHFMEQAVQYNSALFCFASELLQKTDVNLAIYAASSSSGAFCRQFLEHCPLRSNRDFLWQVRNHVNEQLALQSTYMSEIVGTMDHASKHHLRHDDSTSKQQQQQQPNDIAGTSPFAILNQGYETTAVYKKLIGEYLGVPSGQWLQVLRRASEHLQRPNDLLYLRTHHDWDGDATAGDKDGNDDDDDETGIAVKSVALIMRQTRCSRAEAVQALKKNYHDPLDSLVSLSKEW